MAPHDVVSPPRAVRAQQTKKAFSVLERLRAPSPGGCPSLEESREHRRRLLLHHIVTLNIGVADAVAQRYRGRGLADEDLRQVAYEGLVKAVSRFDPAASDDLLTYAVPVIRGELQRHFRDIGWTVRPPRRVQELQFKLQRTWGDLSQELGRTPTEEEVLERVDATPEEAREADLAQGCFTPTSLDRPLGQDGDAASLGDVIPGPDGQEGAAEARVLLAPLVGALSRRDRLVLRLRFVEDLTQEEIGRHLGVTQMQVSRILRRILDALREQIGDPHEFAA